jgi:cytochrome P450
MLVEDVPFLDIDHPGFAPECDEVAEAREQHWWARTSRAPYVLRHAEARQLLQDRRLVHGAQKAMVMMGVTAGPTFDWWNNAIMSLEGDDHARIRSLVQKAFTPAGVESLRGFTRATAERLAAEIDPDGCEFEAAFGEPLPTLVMCELLGVPTADYDAFHRYANDIGLAFSREISAEQLPRIDAAITGLSDYVAGLIADRRRNLGDDLLSSLITVEEHGERLSTDELHNLVLILVWSGQDTTARQLGRALVAFAQHPDQWRLLAEQPNLVDQAVDEVCRWSPQTRMLWRFATEDLTYDDLDIPANSMVLIGVVPANRDSRAWGDSADRFDITVPRRAINLDFSAGIHLCLGANLARLEMTEGLRALTRRFGPPEVTGDITWRPPSAAIHGPDALPLCFTTSA